MNAASGVRADVGHDVIVVGGGIAGWTAARRGQQLGASVALLERGPAGPGWGGLRNAVVPSGGIHAAYLNPRTRSPDELHARLMQKTDGHGRPDVVRAWAENARRGLEFLLSEGAEVRAGGAAEYIQNQLTGTPVLAKMMETFVREGGSLRLNARAVQLEMSGGAVAGVHVERPDGSRDLVRGRSVILAGSGFQANRAMVEKHITKHSHQTMDADGNNQYAVGDCLLMAHAVGAKLVEMGAFYGNVSLRDGVTNPRLHGVSRPDEIVDVSMVVNGSGERYADEALGDDEWSVIEFRLARPMATTDAPGDSWVVFDHGVWETEGRINPFARRRRVQDPDRPGDVGSPLQMPLNPLITERGGTLLGARSIADLARQAGLPEERLELSVDSFNRFCKDGTPLVPVRTGKAKPIVEPPYHAIPLAIAIYFTMGGPLVNGHGQVLDEQERPIPGLYAAGTTMGGLQGGPRNGYAGGLSAALAFGLLTGEHAANAATSRPRASSRAP